jgi:predicted N-acetyltransferase YhbS
VENVLIRKLKREDAEEINRINGKITKKPDEHDFKRMVEELPFSSVDISYVAECKGKVVGYMITYILSAGFGMEKSAWIATLGVEPKLMGQGIGKALAKEIFTFYSEMKIRNIYTSVRWDSTDLLSFFKTLGFDRSNYINLRKVLD